MTGANCSARAHESPHPPCAPSHIISLHLTLTPGVRLGVYEVTAFLGEGGMGRVYRATDTKLKRQVALKILPPTVAADADRLARFQREAEVLASLNHANIAHIYGLEESEGITALVMELVEGEDLANRIARGPIPVTEALSIARQIAQALEAAHERGIIHRDLKPANIKVRADGAVKVLDFGLAKVTDPAGTTSTSNSESPTLTTPAMTQAGMILGTAAYMSPEQARGTLVGRRSDIWAFGCVFYEMLTGRVAFSGQTTSDTIAKILEREPDWRALPRSTPRQTSELLHRCLQKDQGRRLADIRDARFEIERMRTAGPQRSWLLAWPTISVAGALALTLAVVGTVRWYQRNSAAPGPHALMSVLIGDFNNNTNDPSLDHVLEPLFRMTLEGAGFISAYDRTQFSSVLGLRPPEQLDERAALEIAVKQGLGLVLSGAIERQDNRYSVSVRAIEAVTGVVLANVEDRASSRDHVLAVATKLATKVRRVLGDETADSATTFAQDTLSATSLEVVRDYARAMEALGNSRFDDALHAFARAIARDPNFGLAYAGMAISSRNLGRLQDAETYATQAVSHVGSMTERERYRTRGLYYMVTGDYQACVKEYGDLVARFAADTMARNNLALCLTYLRDMRRALDEMRQVVAILPARALFRENLSTYLSYAGNFQAAEETIRALKDPGLYALGALAFAQVGLGELDRARETYERIGKIDGGATYMLSGLGDIAVYEGRFSEAERLLADGAVADFAAQDPDRAAAKLALLAFVRLQRGRTVPAMTAAEDALKASPTLKIRFLAARAFLGAGATEKARTLAASLADELQAEPQSYAKLLDGTMALRRGDARLAVKALTDANALFDTWLGHLDLGQAFVELGQFTQADSEFDRCIKRRGEALALFLDEDPTFGYFPAVYYYQGRAREGLKAQGFSDSYHNYLGIRGKSTEDPLVEEIRRRIGQ
jgi:eukaryotic-like serine/threonine-protein kinase